MPDSDSSGLTVKELVLRLEGTISGFIQAHEARHSAETLADQQARGDAEGSPAGRALGRRIADLGVDVDALAKMVGSHETTLQRMLGAMALLTALGLGTLLLVFLRLTGVIG